jgi:peroxiredoxin Q/BCP
MELKEGDLAPEVTAINQDGMTVRLIDLRGRPVFLYFYPMDNTPGCTAEACAVRDEFAEFRTAGAVVYGVSRQDAASHRKFRDKYQLPFDLLVDRDGALATAFGVPRLPILGIHRRQSVLIGPDGRIARIYRKVSPRAHASEVLRDIRALTPTAAAR